MNTVFACMLSNIKGGGNYVLNMRAFFGQAAADREASLRNV